MSRGAISADGVRRLGLVLRGIASLRSPPDLAGVLAAPDPVAMGRRALVPMARHLGVATCLLPAAMREEATAAFLACRVLDAFEDLGEDRAARLGLAVDYLCGRRARPPELLGPVPGRRLDRLDAVLAGRIADVRDLLLALPAERRARIRSLLDDIGAAMARNLAHPLPRDTYGREVLGRVVRYAVELVAARPVPADLCGAVGVLAQMANDLRDGDGEPYGATTRAELSRQVFLRLPPLVLAAFALLGQVGAAPRGRGVRAAAAYVTVTTAGFLCGQAGVRAPYRRRAQLPAALLAALGPRRFTAVLDRVRAAVNEAVTHLGGTRGITLVDAAPPSGTGLPELLVGAAFRLVGDLPTGPLTGGLAGTHVLRVMLADQLALGALNGLDERGPDFIDEMRHLADLIQQAAVKGVRP
ncbi:hypothetical protein F4553_007700 [Allocatelliglobosispora scoriae]|uniref:Uncharacterized protein n=1 Tax=Allocatelliglobosispora scoriae TaxID=643052 RepID=A0A841C2Y4_9ACTN|nr:hypothetical protein [Allocatelliglobosispora scoriae]MBB5874266.1 hypothetical protein [Allocatelliglobosispora scoriae]